MKSVLILGAGFAGLELATSLSEQVPEDVDVTVIDQNDSFVFGFSKLDVMFGRAEPEKVHLSYSLLDKPAVEFRRETVRSIDASNRRVTTDAGSYEPDILVVALGADLDPAATPGLLEGGSEYYTVPGAEQVRSVLPDFPGGEVIISVLGPFFKCPAAPFETAMMMHSYLGERGRIAQSSITIISPMPVPVPISPEASGGILKALEEREIGWWPQSKVTSLDPASKIANLADGRTAGYDLFLGVPVHRAPASSRNPTW